MSDLHNKSSHQSNTPSTKGRKRWITYAVLVVILLALVFVLDVRSLALAVVSIPPAFLAMVLGIASLDRLMMGYKWRHLILTIGGNISLGSAVSAYYQSGFSSRLLPIPMASDLLRIHIVRQAGLPLELIVSSIVLEKLLAYLASTFLAIIGLVYLFPLISLEQDILSLLGLAIVLIIALVALGFILTLYSPTHRLAGKYVTRFLPEILNRLLHKYSRSILSYRDHPGALLINLILAFVEQLIQIAKFLVLARAIGIELPIMFLFFTIALMLVVRRILNYFESWGLAEAGSVVILSLLGIDETMAVALIFLNFVTTTVAMLPGVYLMYRSDFNLQDWKKGKVQMPSTPSTAIVIVDRGNFNENCE